MTITTSSYTLLSRYDLNDLRYSVVENGRWMSSFLGIFLNREDGSFFFNPRRLKVNIHQKSLRPRLEANDSKAQTFFKFNSAFRYCYWSAELFILHLLTHYAVSKTTVSTYTNFCLCTGKWGNFALVETLEQLVLLLQFFAGTKIWVIKCLPGFKMYGNAAKPKRRDAELIL